MMNLVKDNPLFNEMATYMQWSCSRQRALSEEKEKVIKQFGFDSEEYKAIREKLDAMKADPYGAGAWKAWRAVYNNENEQNPDDLCIKDFCWDEELKLFVETLRKFGVTTFVTIDDSTALMRMIHGLIGLGCEMVGIETVDKKKLWNDEKDPYEHQLGLRFNL